MFGNQETHEAGVKRRYIENVRSKRNSYKEQKRLRKRGATLKNPIHKLDRKIERCYPRGPAFLRMVYLHTVKQLLGK